jgi:hypothetical protein
MLIINLVRTVATWNYSLLNLRYVMCMLLLSHDQQSRGSKFGRDGVRYSTGTRFDIRQGRVSIFRRDEIRCSAGTRFGIRQGRGSIFDRDEIRY